MNLNAEQDRNIMHLLQSVESLNTAMFSQLETLRSLCDRVQALEQRTQDRGLELPSRPSSVATPGPAEKPSESPSVNLAYDQGQFLLTVRTSGFSKLMRFTEDEWAAICNRFSIPSSTWLSLTPFTWTTAAGDPGVADHSESAQRRIAEGNHGWGDGLDEIRSMQNH